MSFGVWYFICSRLFIFRLISLNSQSNNSAYYVSCEKDDHVNRPVEGRLFFFYPIELRRIPRSSVSGRMNRCLPLWMFPLGQILARRVLFVALARQRNRGTHGGRD